ncbi:glucose-dependent insulinotropic receptor isoform X1 [Dicentrarchus labrax]|uniref:G-protein coupled receptors family 1 profile domain-containing protein n=2 Tax=Dicentrarchus labrax TaxID=13489 RepID=A0A8C4H910_DICLA|nr:glucose-dependent insulinotropic receptor isoform X1 [Dicentrarchus labrax]
MSYLCGHASTEPSVRMSSDCMDSNESTSQGDMRPRVMGLILSIASCLIISTNLLVAAALLKLLLKKSSQSWCFVLNLALADALVGVAITGLATEDFNNNSKNITQNQYSHITAGPPTNATPPAQGKTRCLMQMAFVTSPCTASIMSMFLISLDRYAAIKMPLRYSQLSGKGTAVGSLLALWISSLILGFLPVMVRQLQRDVYSGFCAFFSVIEVGMIALFSACFFPVLSVFVYIYLDILKIACSHQKQICQVRQAGSRTGDHQNNQHHEHQHHQQLRSGYWSHVKALRTVAVLVGCFLVLWCPFFVACIVHLLCETCELTDVLENYLWLLGLSNSLINPLVYAFWQREVRLQLAAMFSCFTGSSLAVGPPGVATRSDPPPVLTPAGVPSGDTLNPSLLQSVIEHDKTHIVPLSATTSL